MFLRSMPALKAIAAAFESMKMVEEGITGIPINLPDSAIEGIFPLLAVMSDITVDEFKSLPLIPDGMAVLNAFSLFMPKNAPVVQTNEAESFPTGPQNTLSGGLSGEITE